MQLAVRWQQTDSQLPRAVPPLARPRVQGLLVKVQRPVGNGPTVLAGSCRVEGAGRASLRKADSVLHPAPTLGGTHTLWDPRSRPPGLRPRAEVAALLLASEPSSEPASDRRAW